MSNRDKRVTTEIRVISEILNVRTIDKILYVGDERINPILTKYGLGYSYSDIIQYMVPRSLRLVGNDELKVSKSQMDSVDGAILISGPDRHNDIGYRLMVSAGYKLVGDSKNASIRNTTPYTIAPPIGAAKTRVVEFGNVRIIRRIVTGRVYVYVNGNLLPEASVQNDDVYYYYATLCEHVLGVKYADIVDKAPMVGLLASLPFICSAKVFNLVMYQLRVLYNAHNNIEMSHPEMLELSVPSYGKNHECATVNWSSPTVDQTSDADNDTIVIIGNVELIRSSTGLLTISVDGVKIKSVDGSYNVYRVIALMRTDLTNSKSVLGNTSALYTSVIGLINELTDDVISTRLFNMLVKYMNVIYNIISKVAVESQTHNYYNAKLLMSRFINTSKAMTPVPADLYNTPVTYVRDRVTISKTTSVSDKVSIQYGHASDAMAIISFHSMYVVIDKLNNLNVMYVTDYSLTTLSAEVTLYDLLLPHGRYLRPLTDDEMAVISVLLNEPIALKASTDEISHMTNLLRVMSMYINDNGATTESKSIYGNRAITHPAATDRYMLEMMNNIDSGYGTAPSQYNRPNQYNAVNPYDPYNTTSLYGPSRSCHSGVTGGVANQVGTPLGNQSIAIGYPKR